MSKFQRLRSATNRAGYLSHSRAAPLANAERPSPDSRAGSINLLGSPRLEWRGRTWTLPAKAFALIALLSERPGYTMPRAQLRDILWGELDQPRANASMRQLIARVRTTGERVGSDILRTDWRNVALNADEYAVDLVRLFALDVEGAVEGKDVQRLEEFVIEYTDILLAGMEIDEPNFEEWLSGTRNRLHREALLALIYLLNEVDDCDVQKRQRLANRLLKLDSTQEAAYRVLMETYAAQGERVLALQAFQRCCNVLRAELGVEPEPSTRRLAIALGCAEMLAEPSQPLRARAAPVGIGEDAAREADAGIPKVILLPPTVVAGDGLVNRVASALVDDVISGLARCRSFIVIAPHTAHRLSAEGDPLVDSHSKLNVKYLIHTTVKPMFSGSAAVFRLTELKTGVVLWSAEVDFSLKELPALFLRLSESVIFALADAIERAELRFPTVARNSSAYRMYLEGRSNMISSDLPDLRRARSWFRRSIERCGGYAPALAGLSRTITLERLARGITDIDPLNEALELADMAVEADPFDGRGMRERGYACLYLRRHGESLDCFGRAAELNPHEADLFADYADALAHSGQPEKGREMCLKAIDLNPLHPDYYNWILGSIDYQLEQYEAAIESLTPVSEHPGAARLLAACSAMAGRTTEARRYADIVRDNYPGFRIEDLFEIVPDKNPRDTRRLLQGLRLAGLS